ncbi:hypothetical protein M5K25_024462 [Dendrobium thyrsiflorum]|uniref:Uncharacterized protein n=1 Tax=Dendrobium thyrsiflorum TaxID=117978 RepID=A0ABD0U2C1_DENTH
MRRVKRPFTEKYCGFVGKIALADISEFHLVYVPSLMIIARIASTFTLVFILLCLARFSFLTQESEFSSLMFGRHIRLVNIRSFLSTLYSLFRFGQALDLSGEAPYTSFRFGQVNVEFPLSFLFALLFRFGQASIESSHSPFRFGQIVGLSFYSLLTVSIWSVAIGSNSPLPLSLSCSEKPKTKASPVFSCSHLGGGTPALPLLFGETQNQGLPRLLLFAPRRRNSLSTSISLSGSSPRVQRESQGLRSFRLGPTQKFPSLPTCSIRQGPGAGHHPFPSVSHLKSRLPLHLSLVDPRSEPRPSRAAEPEQKPRRFLYFRRRQGAEQEIETSSRLSRLTSLPALGDLPPLPPSSYLPSLLFYSSQILDKCCLPYSVDFTIRIASTFTLVFILLCLARFSFLTQESEFSSLMFGRHIRLVNIRSFLSTLYSLFRFGQALDLSGEAPYTSFRFGQASIESSHSPFRFGQIVGLSFYSLLTVSIWSVAIGSNSPLPLSLSCSEKPKTKASPVFSCSHLGGGTPALPLLFGETQNQGLPRLLLFAPRRRNSLSTSISLSGSSPRVQRESQGLRSFRLGPTQKFPSLPTCSIRQGPGAGHHPFPSVSHLKSRLPLHLSLVDPRSEPRPSRAAEPEQKPRRFLYFRRRQGAEQEIETSSRLSRLTSLPALGDLPPLPPSSYLPSLLFYSSQILDKCCLPYSVDFTIRIASTFTLVFILLCLARILSETHTHKVGKADDVVSTITGDSLIIFRKKIHFPNDLVMKVSAKSDRSCAPPSGFLTVYEFSLRAGLRFPPTSELIDILQICGVSLSQLSYRAMLIIMGLIVFFRDHRAVLSPVCLSRMGRLISNMQGRISFRSIWLDIRTRDPSKGWFSDFFFVQNDWNLQKNGENGRIYPFPYTLEKRIC